MTWDELACKDAARTPYPLAWRSTRAVDLAVLFERIRSACGDVPITVLSAYRTEAWNRHIGGAPKSQHVEGRALDLDVPAGWTFQDFYRVIRGLHRSGGIGQYEHAGFVHVDIRPGESLHAWNGGSQLKEARRT
jgi:uncharacterized protein YcbK (DUF882 family)